MLQVFINPSLCVDFMVEETFIFSPWDYYKLYIIFVELQFLQFLDTTDLFSVPSLIPKQYFQNTFQ